MPDHDDYLPPRDDPKERPFEAFDTNTEQFVIGWCLRDPAAIAWAMAILGPNDFYHDLHQRIFERVTVKHGAGRPVTPATINAAMKNDPELAEVGGIDYLNDWYLGAPSVTGDQLQRQVEDHARTIKDFKSRRDAIEATYGAWLDLQQPGEVANALAPIVYLADLAADQTDAAAGSVMVTDAASSLLRELEQPEDDGKITAAPTGLALLNEVIGGIQPTDLVVVGGRPGMGKSIFGTMVARTAAAAYFHVDYFSLEMTARQLTARMLCDLDYDRALREGINPIDYSRVLLRRISSDERGRLAEANLNLAGLPLEIHDRDELTIDQIASITRAKMASAPGPRIVVIDHMHLIEPSARYRGRKIDEISEITKGAKRMAKRLGVGVVLLAQLNREVEKREEKMPTMADFRDAGSIEQDSDVMLGLNRPAVWLQRGHAKESDEDRTKRIVLAADKANVLELGIIKNRHGSTKDLTLFCDVARSVFRDQHTMQGGGGEDPLLF